MGVGSVALTFTTAFPTYPDPLSAAQLGAGLSSPAAAIALLGQGGAVLMLLLLFMAVTSSTSAELIAVSSLLTFDVYKTYIKPDATSNRLVQISHYGIIIYGLVLAAFCCGLNAAGLNLTWLLTVLGIIVGGASVPVGLILMWGRMSTVAAVTAPWVGLGCGLIAWFVTTTKRSGTISIETSGQATNAVAGNVTSWGSGFLAAVLLSLVFTKKYTSTDPTHVERYNKVHGITSGTPSASTTPPNESRGHKDLEKEAVQSRPVSNRGSETIPSAGDYAPTGNDLVDYLETSQMQPMDPILVKKGTRLAATFSIVFIAIAVILVPFTLFGTEYICEFIDYRVPCIFADSARQSLVLYWIRCGVVHMGLGQHDNLCGLSCGGECRGIGPHCERISQGCKGTGRDTQVDPSRHHRQDTIK